MKKTFNVTPPLLVVVGERKEENVLQTSSITTTLPVAPWLLCTWQAREIGVTWWGVLLTMLFVHLTKMLLETLASASPPTDHTVDIEDPQKTSKKNKATHNNNRGWPELLRASIGIIISVYVLENLLFWVVSSSGEGATVTGGESMNMMFIMLFVLSGVMDYTPPTSQWSLSLIGLMTVIGVFLRETHGGGSTNIKNDFTNWLQFLLSTHAVMVGYVNPHTTSSEQEAEPSNKSLLFDTLVRNLCMISVIFFTSTTGSSRNNLALLLTILFLILPALCLKGKQSISDCITPILDQLCHPDLYPLKDPNKAEARNALLMQQKQEILFYIMAWCVVLGLWAHVRPVVLLWTQITGGIMYLASLRRYSNVIRILNFQHHHPTTYHQKATTATAGGKHHHEVPGVMRRRPATSTSENATLSDTTTHNNQHPNLGILTQLMQKPFLLSSPSNAII
jgi:hypothetical protein